MSAKKRVLFVDDEPNLLAGLRRMLRSMRKEWDMIFVAGGAEALAVLAEQPVDVIVSDMRMPGMDGAELLGRVRVEAPQTVRIVLSGQAEREAVLRGAAAIHQYLGKPCDADTLKDTVRRACALVKRMPNADVRRVISQLDPFEALPISLDEVIAQLKDADTPVSGLTHLVSAGMGIETQVVRQIDAALSSLRAHIPSPAQASVLLGLNTLKLLALSAQVFRQYEHQSLAMTALHSMWHHGIAVGKFAARIAQVENAPPPMVDFAAVAGLLHDIGKLIFTGYFAESYIAVRQKSIQAGVDSLQAEMEEFGVTHADVGAYLLALWGLPAPVVTAVKYHNAPPPNASSEFSATLAVYVGNALEYESRVVRDITLSDKLDMAYLEKLGVSQRLPVWREACHSLVGEGVA